jgi:O-methyltransferase
MHPLKCYISKLINMGGYKLTRLNKSETTKSDELDDLYEKFKDYTMTPRSLFIDNLNLCDRFKNVEGCVVECGVWRGGMIAGIAEIMGNERKYYLFDSFEGLPQVQEIDGEAAINWQKDKDSSFYYDNCKAEIDFAQQAMRSTGIINYQVVKGWFSETLSTIPEDEKIAILRLDGDWYESTIECLNSLYPKLSKGGVVIIDDYYAWDGCSKAVHDYLSRHQLSDKLYQLGEWNSYFIKR